MREQADYQVRLAWGADGLARLAPSDVVVLVDVLGGALGPSEPSELEALAVTAAASGAVVLRGGLTNAAAVADVCLALQHERGARTSVAVVAARERFAAEDLLGAGAVVDALAVRGTDHSSPEAAVACEAFAGLRRAVVHLVSASVTGRELAAIGRDGDVAAASQVDATTEVPCWVDDGWGGVPRVDDGAR